MILQSIRLVNYKSYHQFQADFHPRLNAILGLNGVGKTNLLDAIYFSCLGKSFFSAGDRYVKKHDSAFFRIEAVFSEETRNSRFVAKVIPGKTKILSIDDKEIEKIGDHIGRFPCILVSPRDILLLLEGSAERRRLLNNTLIQHDTVYIHKSIVYNRLLKQRNALLKTFAEKRYFDQKLLDSISVNMYEPASYIHQKRNDLISEISPLFASFYEQISGSKEACAISYKSPLLGGNLQDLFQQNLERDRILGRTSAGIHKDDMIFKMNDIPLKPFGSQGQLKSFVLALKLAQYYYLKKKLNTKPLLLLDDLFDKLDDKRVKNLLSILHNDDFGQVFMTDKDEYDITHLLEQISADYRTFVIREDSSKYSEEE